MKTLCLIALTLAAASTLHAAEPCQTFHGRAHFYSGDSQFRIWHIGTHHEFEPDYAGTDQGTSWDRVIDLLKAGDEDAGAASLNDLYATFTVCPTKPLVPGAVQPAIVKRIEHPRVVPSN